MLQMGETGIGDSLPWVQRARPYGTATFKAGRKEGLALRGRYMDGMGNGYSLL